MPTPLTSPLDDRYRMLANLALHEKVHDNIPVEQHCIQDGLTINDIVSLASGIPVFLVPEYITDAALIRLLRCLEDELKERVFTRASLAGLTDISVPPRES